MFRRWSAIGTIMALSVLTMCLTGCVITAPRCLPAALSVSPSSVAAGGSVTVSSPAANCAVKYKDGHTYTITLSAHAVIAKLVTASVAHDGSFSKEIPIPADFPRGTAYLAVSGSPFDACDDGGGSCAGYGIAITVK